MSGAGGYPVRPTRSDFGPEPKNRTVVRDAEYELDGETVGRLMFFTMAGGARTIALARIRVDDLGSGPVAIDREEAWNPNKLTSGPYAAPTITALATGRFQIAYPATVPDREGTLRELLLTGGHAQAVVLASNANLHHCEVRLTDPSIPSSVVEVRCWSWSDWAAADVPFDVWLY